MNLRTSVTFVALMLAAPAVIAAADPSFTGWWRLDEAASTGVPPMMKGHDTVVQLTQTGETFVIEFVFDGKTMNTSEFILDGKTHPGQMGATQEARWIEAPRRIELTIHRPEGGQMPGGDEVLVWEVLPDGQEIHRTSTRPKSDRPPSTYVYRRLNAPPRKPPQ